MRTLSPNALERLLDLDDDTAQTRARRDLDLLEVQLPHLVGLGGHLLVTGQTGLGLGLPPLGVGADPLQLFLEPLLRAWRPSAPSTLRRVALFSRYVE